MSHFVFGLITETPRITVRQLYSMAWALEENARHCASAWGLSSPAVVVLDNAKKLPRNCQPIVFVDDAPKPGLLGEHYWDPFRAGPAARVYVGAGTGLTTGEYSVCEAASHEILEAMLNPQLIIWVDVPGRPGVQMARELCDPTQEHYKIEVKGFLFPVSDFVKPAYFRADLIDDKKRAQYLQGDTFSHLGVVKRPFEIGPEGFAVYRSSATKLTWTEFGSKTSPRHTNKDVVAARKHPWGRSARLTAP